MRRFLKRLFTGMMCVALVAGNVCPAFAEEDYQDMVDAAEQPEYFDNVDMVGQEGFIDIEQAYKAEDAAADIPDGADNSDMGGASDNGDADSAETTEKAEPEIKEQAVPAAPVKTAEPEITGDVNGNKESIAEYADVDSNNDGQADNIQAVFNDNAARYSLGISTQKISFGKVAEGQPADAQTVYLTNTGASQVNLIWKDVDPDCAFSIDTLQALQIAPGQSVPVNISLATNKSAGKYNGVVLFADATDTAYASGVKLEISVTVVEDKATVKRVTIYPADTAASAGATVDFQAEVEGDGNFDKAVSYKVSGNKSADTTVDGNGRLKIASNESASSITVRATSVADSNVYKEAQVSIRKNTYTVNVYPSPRRAGDVTGGGAYSAGESATLRAYSSNGWYFTGWEINGVQVSTGSTYQLDNVNQNYEVAAVFEQDCVRIKAKPNHKEMGTVEGDGYAEVGDTVVLKAEPKKGYVFSCWMEGKKKISSDKKLKLKSVDEDRELTAVFKKNECVVSVASCDETMGKVSGGKTVAYGKDVTIKATPNKGYRFVKWVCNDNQISTNKECKLPEIKDDITVVAIFEAEKQVNTMYTLVSGTADSNGVISPSGTIQIEKGKSINYTITPKNGYRIAAIAVDGKSVNVTSSLTLSRIASNHTVVAAFAPIAKQADSTPAKSAEAAKPSKTETAKTTAADSDINKAIDITPEKKYDENVIDADIDTTTYVGDESDSMNNELDDSEGTLQTINMLKHEANAQLGDDAFKYDLIKQAVATEALEINIDNTMRRNKFVMSYDENALENPETVNFAQILCGVFSDEEVMKLVSGEEKVAVDVSVTGVQEDNVPLGQVREISDNMPEGKKAGQYFFANFVKNVDGDAQEVSEFNTPIMVTVDVPEGMYAEGEKYTIARLHSGAAGYEFDELTDLDDNPKTVTFETDRFSTYAILCSSDIAADTNAPIARPVINRKNAVSWAVVGLAGVVAGVIGMLIVSTVMRSRRRRRRKMNR